MADLVKPYLFRNVPNGTIGFFKEPCGTGQAMFHQVLIGRCLQAYPEAAQALRFTNMGTLRKLFQCDFLGVMRFHILQKAAHPGIDRISCFCGGRETFFCKISQSDTRRVNTS